MSRTARRDAATAGRVAASRWVVAYVAICGGWLLYVEGIAQAFAADTPWLAAALRYDRWALIALSAVALYVMAARMHIRTGLTELERTGAEGTLGNLMGSVPGIAYRCTNDFVRTMQLVSAGAFELTGYPPEDFVDNRRLDFESVIHEADREHVGQEIARALLARGRYRIIYRIRRLDGEERWVMDSGCGVDEVDGRFTCLEGLMVDVTTQKVVERRLDGQRRHLQEIVEARTQELTDEIEERKRLEGRLRELSRRDGLTGLLNRRSMDEHLEEELERGLRYGGEFSVVMVDLDKFKTLNDTYGHAGGDAVLREVSRRLQEGIRASDWAFRYGGEELALVLTNSGGRGAWAVADRLRAQLAEHRIRLQDEKTEAFHDVQVTFSAGVACFPHDGRSVERLMAAADSALYEAKRGGRNRVMQAGMIALPTPVPGPPGPPPPPEDAYS